MADTPPLPEHDGAKPADVLKAPVPPQNAVSQLYASIQEFALKVGQSEPMTKFLQALEQKLLDRQQIVRQLQLQQYHEMYQLMSGQTQYQQPQQQQQLLFQPNYQNPLDQVRQLHQRQYHQLYELMARQEQELRMLFSTSSISGVALSSPSLAGPRPAPGFTFPASDPAAKRARQ